MRFLMASVALIAAIGVTHGDVQSLDGASLGTHWFGPNHTKDDLKGRVVVVEMWGFN